MLFTRKEKIFFWQKLRNAEFCTPLSAKIKKAVQHKRLTLTLKTLKRKSCLSRSIEIKTPTTKEILIPKMTMFSDQFGRIFDSFVDDTFLKVPKIFELHNLDLCVKVDFINLSTFVHYRKSDL